MTFARRTYYLIGICGLLGALYWFVSVDNPRISSNATSRSESQQMHTVDSPVSLDLPLFQFAPGEKIVRASVQDFANRRHYGFELKAEGWEMSDPIQFPLDVDVARLLNSLLSIRVQKKFQVRKEDLFQYGLHKPQIHLCVATEIKGKETCYDFGDNVPNQTACYGLSGNDVVIAPKSLRDLWLGQTEYGLVRKQVFPVLFYGATKITIREGGWFSVFVKNSGGWLLERPTSKTLTNDQVKEFFTLISNLHARSFLDVSLVNRLKWSPNRRIVVEYESGQSESLILGDVDDKLSGYQAKLSSWRSPLVISKEKYDELIRFVKQLAIGSVV